MANITATQYTDYISNYGGKFDHFEQRGSAYGALRAFQEESNPSDPRSMITPQLVENVRKSFGITVKEPVLDYFAPTLATSRVCTFATEGATSDLVTLVFNTYRSGFVIARADNTNNYVKYQNEWQRDFDGVLEKIGRQLDADAVAVLELNKNTYWTGVAPEFYTETGDVLQVPNADKDDMYNQVQAIYQKMDYNSSDIKVIDSPRHTPLVRRYANQGSGNSTNLGFQFGPYTWYPTNRVTDTADGSLFTFPRGSVGMMTRMDPDSLDRSRIHESNYWDVMEGVPLLNSQTLMAAQSQAMGLEVTPPARIDLGVHYQAECKDVTSIKAAALAGLTASKAESWWFSFDVVFVVNRNSRAEASPPTDFGSILKFDVLSA